MKTKRFLIFTILLTVLGLCGCGATEAQIPLSESTTTITSTVLETPAADNAFATDAPFIPTTETQTPEIPPATPSPEALPAATDKPLPATPAGTELPNPTPVPCNMPHHSYTSLSVPTQITKIGEDYFLVDCYHNQILSSPSLDKPLEEWYVMSDQINRGHTIAGNGSVYLADDTENHRILVFQKEGADFVQTQVFENIGNRPHYVEYLPATERFYALSSMSGELYVFQQEDSFSEVRLEQVLNIPDMQNAYIRSFTIDGEEIYFSTNNGIILRCRLTDLEVLEQWVLPDEIAGLVQLTKIGEFFYLTVSTDKAGNAEYATIIRTKDLSYLQEYGYDDLYAVFEGDGTPYYISSFDNHYYLTQHCYLPGHGVWQFDIQDEEICNVIPLYP